MDYIGSTLASSPILIALCTIVVLLHFVEFLFGGKWWLSFLVMGYHILAILTFLSQRATLADILIFLMLSTATSLTLRLIRRKNK